MSVGIYNTAARIIEDPRNGTPGFTQYIANGIATFYEYGFPVLPSSIVFVRLDGILTTDYTAQDTGITFPVAPALGVLIAIQRRTDIDQLESWEPFDDFKGERTEDAVDKLIIQKQEAEYRRTLTLATARNVREVEVISDKGLDAHVPLWNQDGTEAGMFSGKVSTSAPVDGATDPYNAPGHTWMQWDDDIPPPYTPESNALSSTTGWAVTQNNWSGNPDFPHPLQGQSFDEFTIATVCRNNAYPNTSTDQKAFDIGWGMGGTGLGIRRRPLVPNTQIFWVADMHSWVGGNIEIMEYHLEHDLFLVSDEGWHFNDCYSWTWIGLSFSRSQQKVTFGIQNLETGRFYAEDRAISHPTGLNQPVAFEPSGSATANSVCIYGSGTTNFTQNVGNGYWRGFLSQTWVGDRYFDFKNVSDMRRFVNADGVKAIVDGTEIDGAPPLIYMPNGHVSSNVGTANIGAYPADYRLLGTESFNVEIPPLSATP